MCWHVGTNVRNIFPGMLKKNKVPGSNRVETAFSVMKRKSGEAARARLFRLRVTEIRINVILCNLSIIHERYGRTVFQHR
jgi:hypothetical protein